VEWVEGQRGDLGAAEAEGRDEVLAEQVAAVRPKGAPGPPGCRERVDDPQVAGQAVAVHRIEQQDVAGGPQARVLVEQCRLGRGEQCLTRCDRGVVASGDIGVGSEIQRVADVLEPPQPEARQLGGRSERPAEVVAIHRIDRQVVTA
jgi:hypothetical protein